MKAISFLFGLAPILGLSAAHAGTIQQSRQFPNVSPHRLYQAYLCSGDHSDFTHLPAIINPVVGGAFKAAYGVLPPGPNGEPVPALTGTIISLDPGTHEPNTFVVTQTWRDPRFVPTDLDSTLVLTFKLPPTGSNPGGAELNMVQTNAPDVNVPFYDADWNYRYWDNLTTYLAGNPASKCPPLWKEK